METPFPKISIVTVNFNQPEVTEDLLKSLKNISYPNYEVFVVDNGSSNNNLSLLENKYPDINFIYSSENLGFAGGNNLAMKLTTGDAVLYINNDVEVPKSFLEPLVKRLYSEKNIGMVSPKIKFHHTPTHIQYAGATKMNPLTISNKQIGYNEKDIGQYNQSRQTNYAHGACMLVSKDAIDSIGYMENTFFLYYEEIDWCERIKKGGYKIWYEANSEIYHKESISTGKNSPLKTYYLTRNRLYYAKRNQSKIDYAIGVSYFTLFSIPVNTIKYVFKMEIDLLKSFYKGIKWNLVR